MTNLETNYLTYPEAIKEAVQPGYDSGLKEDRWLGATLSADSAVLEGTLSTSFGIYTSEEPHYVFWSDRPLESPSKAIWSINIPDECDITISLDLGPEILSNKHRYEISVLNNSVQVGTLTEGKYDCNESNQIKTLSGTIHIPSTGEYTLELINNRDFSKGSIKNVIIERV